MFINEVEKWFPNFELVNGLSIMFLQFWMHHDVDSSFSLHLGVIKKHYSEIKIVKPSFLQTTKPSNANILDIQMCMFKLTMKMQTLKAMNELFDTNPMTKLWYVINSNALWTQRLSGYMKLVEIAIVSVPESIENEQTFSILAFMKDNWIGPYLDIIVRMFAQESLLKRLSFTKI